jgi:poly(A) polymerase
MTWSSLSKAASISEGSREPVKGSDQALWSRVLLGPQPDDALEHLQATGVLRSTFPELQAMVGFGGGDQGHKDLWAHVKQVVLQSRPDLVVRWAALFHDVGKVETFSRESGKVSFHHHESASARLFLRASRRSGLLEPEVQKKSHFLVRHLGLLEAYASDWTDSAVRRLMKELGEHFDRTLVLARADITTKHDDKRQRYYERLHELATRAKDIAARDAIVPPLPKGLGDALMTAFGIPPSKRLGELKVALEKAVDAGRAQPHQPADYYVSFLAEHREEFGLGELTDGAS